MGIVGCVLIGAVVGFALGQLVVSVLGGYADDLMDRDYRRWLGDQH